MLRRAKKLSRRRWWARTLGLGRTLERSRRGSLMWLRSRSQQSPVISLTDQKKVTHRDPRQYGLGISLTGQKKATHRDPRQYGLGFSLTDQRKAINQDLMRRFAISCHCRLSSRHPLGNDQSNLLWFFADSSEPGCELQDQMLVSGLTFPSSSRYIHVAPSTKRWRANTKTLHCVYKTRIVPAMQYNEPMHGHVRHPHGMVLCLPRQRHHKSCSLIT